MDPKDENYNTSRGLMIALPLMLGWFSLNVPAGLSLYYLSNTVLTSAQQIYLKKLGGANVSMVVTPRYAMDGTTYGYAQELKMQMTSNVACMACMKHT